MIKPAYRQIEPEVLAEKAARAWEILSDCTVCPQNCRVNRLEDKRGFCRTGSLPMISSYGPHFGEEPPLVGRFGSGTIFFTNCNMRCEFCQNYEISQCGRGDEISCRRLGEIMIRLQDAGCHNINLVSPSHVVPHILKALCEAVPRGLSIPLVYNSGGYDAVPTLRLLEGVIDIYMPDAKYGNDEVAFALSHAPHYTHYMKDSLREMQRQVGDLVIENGIAIKGLIIRHLVLPNDLAGSKEIMCFIAEEISKDAYVNIMDQYHFTRSPLNDKNRDNPLIKHIQRRITAEEYRYAIACARDVGLYRGFD